MPIPAPSPSQLASLIALKALADSGAEGADDTIAAIQTAIDVQQDAEDYQKTVFDHLNDSIIRKYEFERRWMDGLLLEEPIIEDDLQDFSNKQTTSRIWNGGTYTPSRVAEFDGGTPVYQDDINETKQFEVQDEILDMLVNGIPGMITLTPGSDIASAIDENSTSVVINENIVTISADDVLLIIGGGTFAVLKAISASNGGVCTGEMTPPQLTESACTMDGGTWENSTALTFEYIIPPSSTIPMGTAIGQLVYNGFNNTERTNHTSGSFQIIMDYLLERLRTSLEDRKVALENELQVIGENANDDIDPTAATNVQASLDAVEAFLGNNPPDTIDVSDSGITALNNEKSVRLGQVSQRITDIANEITAGNFYDLRFNSASGRAHLANGSITILRELNDAKAGQVDGKAQAQGLSARYASLIP